MPSFPRSKRPPLQEYIRHLIFTVLSDASIQTVLRKLLKLPWAQHEAYVVKCLLKVGTNDDRPPATCLSLPPPSPSPAPQQPRASQDFSTAWGSPPDSQVVRGRFSNIQLVSCLSAGLAQYHPSLGVALVDCLLEDIRLGLESPGAGMYQKRMADCRLLGELYNYMLCNRCDWYMTCMTLLWRRPVLCLRLSRVAMTHVLAWWRPLLWTGTAPSLTLTSSPLTLHQHARVRDALPAAHLWAREPRGRRAPRPARRLLPRAPGAVLLRRGLGAAAEKLAPPAFFAFFKNP